MNIETLKQMSTVRKIEIPVYAALYEVRSQVHENAPKIGRKNGERFFDLLKKLENKIDELVADEKDI